MRSFGQFFIAGAAGVLALKILGGLLLPLLAMVLGLFGLLVKLALIGAVIWFVMRMLKGRDQENND